MCIIHHFHSTKISAPRKGTKMITILYCRLTIFFIAGKLALIEMAKNKVLKKSPFCIIFIVEIFALLLITQKMSASLNCSLFIIFITRNSALLKKALETSTTLNCPLSIIYMQGNSVIFKHEYSRQNHLKGVEEVFGAELLIRYLKCLFVRM